MTAKKNRAATAISALIALEDQKPMLYQQIVDEIFWSR